MGREEALCSALSWERWKGVPEHQINTPINGNISVRLKCREAGSHALIEYKANGLALIDMRKMWRIESLWGCVCVCVCVWERECMCEWVCYNGMVTPPSCECGSCVLCPVLRPPWSSVLSPSVITTYILASRPDGPAVGVCSSDCFCFPPSRSCCSQPPL